MTKLLLFGDLHLRKGHLEQGLSACQALVSEAEKHQPDAIFLLGDVLHTHEMVYVKALRLLEDLLEELRNLAPTYVLVGNHDFVNASENQTVEHPLGTFKKWKNVKIIDTMTLLTFGDLKVIATPYIPYGKFCKSLELFSEGLEVNLEEIDFILAHQPFSAVDPKAERWPEDYPQVYSGHIHDRCTPQENLLYVGSSCQVDFSEKPDKFALLVTEEKIKWLKLSVRSIHFEKVSVEEIEISKLIKIAKEHEIRIIIEASKEEREAYLKSRGYLDLTAIGAKISWDIKQVERVEVPKAKKIKRSFAKILEDLIVESDPKIQEAYKIIYGRSVTTVELT